MCACVCASLIAILKRASTHDNLWRFGVVRRRAGAMGGYRARMKKEAGGTGKGAKNANTKKRVGAGENKGGESRGEEIATGGGRGRAG